ncbi:MAG: hypothetical protein DLM61_13395 [Pseudonocardiales bacterium]|nr:MAG: hypothetical protein DLM61_13395 [Pseudonocardiales bacterium]
MSTLLSTLTVGSFTIELRRATSGNLLTIVRLLAADPLGSSRETTANDEDLRPSGSRMVEWAILEARRRGCALVQLTTDKARNDAHRFYERLGFVASHHGFKLHL